MEIKSNSPKLNKVYRLFIQQQDINGKGLNTGLVITNPMTIRFNIDRSMYSGIANMTIDIYNLSTDHRNRIFKDFFYDIEKENPLFIALSAGYSIKELNTIYAGDVWNAYTRREGPDVITTIQAKTGLRNFAQTISLSVAAGSTAKDVVKQCMDKMPCLTDNHQAIEEYTFSSPISLMGKPLAIIKQYNPNKNVFVDLNNVYILGEDEGIAGWVPLITESSGLLNAPERKTGTLVFNMIFEPRLEVGQVIELRSQLAPQFNGQYKIFGLKHNGIISDTKGGTATTTVEVNVGSELYGVFKPI